MINIVLLTGFLGAGKTTLMTSILDSYKDRKIGIIVNEFGRENIDGMIIKRNGIDVTEISNGSIFCACIKENFLKSLIEMSKRNIEYLFIEASGLADPSNMSLILKTIENRIVNQYNYKGAICIIDSENFLQLYDILPALQRQIEYSSVVIINKVDLVDKFIMDEIQRKIDSIDPSIDVFTTSYCRVDILHIIKSLASKDKVALESTNTIESRLKTIVLTGDEEVPYEKLQSFLKDVSHFSYRIKGFARTDKGVMEINSVGTNVNLFPWREEVKETKIVVISSVGIKIISIITKAIGEYLKEKIHL